MTKVVVPVQPNKVKQGILFCIAIVVFLLVLLSLFGGTEKVLTPTEINSLAKLEQEEGLSVPLPKFDGKSPKFDGKRPKYKSPAGRVRPKKKNRIQKQILEKDPNFIPVCPKNLIERNVCKVLREKKTLIFLGITGLDQNDLLWSIIENDGLNCHEYIGGEMVDESSSPFVSKKLFVEAVPSACGAMEKSLRKKNVRNFFVKHAVLDYGQQDIDDETLAFYCLDTESEEAKQILSKYEPLPLKTAKVCSEDRERFFEDDFLNYLPQKDVHKLLKSYTTPVKDMSELLFDYQIATLSEIGFLRLDQMEADDLMSRFNFDYNSLLPKVVSFPSVQFDRAGLAGKKLSSLGYRFCHRGDKQIHAYKDVVRPTI